MICITWASLREERGYSGYTTSAILQHLAGPRIPASWILTTGTLSFPSRDSNEFKFRDGNPSHDLNHSGLYWGLRSQRGLPG
jgi:hypothetical protein